MPKIIMQCKICAKEIPNTETKSHLREHEPANYYVPVMKITWDELLGIRETKKTKKQIVEEPEEEVEEVEEEVEEE